MYKLLLCWRYLRTRYIALASIISVTLGVATMIVVNAVMAGFTSEMQNRIHGILSDVVFESRSLDGAVDAERHMQKIRDVAGPYIEGMSPTAQVPAMLGYHIGQSGQYRTQPITLIGIDQETYASVSDVGKYLQHPANRERLDFQLKPSGYDVIDHQAEDPAKAKPRAAMEEAGWRHRQKKYARLGVGGLGVGGLSLGEGERSAAPAAAIGTNDPFAGVSAIPTVEFNPATEQHTGCVLGIALASFRQKDGTDAFLQLPGDDVQITYPSSGKSLKPLSATLTVVDFYESKMSEYDGTFVFMPLREMQKIRGMIDPSTGVANFNSIQIRVKEGVDLDMVRDLIAAEFSPYEFSISTWRDKQGALLAAVQQETVVLNVLLFLIIVVAAFGILATFFMIVVEKTRDIGILKSLGAGSGGVMGIFVGYGLTLGIVGAGAGAIGGLLFVAYLTPIADFIGWATGRPVFDPSIYYFHKIPAIVDPWTVAFVTSGAVAVAVLASILPAWRAAAMHPVAALRWE